MENILFKISVVMFVIIGICLIQLLKKVKNFISTIYNKKKRHNEYIKIAKTLINNGGNCTKVNCKKCYYYPYLKDCVASGHIADRYQESPKLVVAKMKEII